MAGILGLGQKTYEDSLQLVPLATSVKGTTILAKKGLEEILQSLLELQNIGVKGSSDAKAKIDELTKQLETERKLVIELKIKIDECDATKVEKDNLKKELEKLKKKLADNEELLKELKRILDESSKEEIIKKGIDDVKKVIDEMTAEAKKESKKPPPAAPTAAPPPPASGPEGGINARDVLPPSETPTENYPMTNDALRSLGLGDGRQGRPPMPPKSSSSSGGYRYTKRRTKTKKLRTKTKKTRTKRR